ncbi:hypothetical protein JCM33374_g1966 [Metschnikowia sp. JCM 33374]|nr:hypothetical protein JCM33374_g1966 [Metschnikowia sp. JCM 33374]
MAQRNHTTTTSLGKRGQSKSHYIGLTCNESMVDEDTIRLVNLDITDLRDYFKNLWQPAKINLITRLKPKCHNQAMCSESNQVPMISPIKSSYSFIDLMCKYPSGDCSPRIWHVTPNTIPKQSLWAKVTMERSVEVLKGHGVNLDPLIANIFEFVFSGNDQYLISDTVIYSIMVLSNRSSPREAFLHLYLVVLLLIFPVTIASDQEVSMFDKLQLRVAVTNCVTKLEDEVSILSCIDEPSLATFIQILRKMIHISEMTSSSSNSSHAESVLKEMAHDIKSLTITASECGDFTVSKMADVTNIHNIGKAFQKVALVATQAMSSIASGITDSELYNDVPYQVFHLSAKLFHEVTLAVAEIVQLPMPVITSIILYYTNEMQQVSFAEFARRGPDLSKDTFKCWWVFSSMFQEYMCVMSEVIALSQALA